MRTSLTVQDEFFTCRIYPPWQAAVNWNVAPTFLSECLHRTSNNTVYSGFVENWETVNQCMQVNVGAIFTKTCYSNKHFGCYFKNISLREQVRKNNDIPVKVAHVLSRQEKHPNTISDEYTSPPCLMQHRRLEMPGMLDSSPMGDHVPLIGYQCPHPQEQCPRWVPTQ